MNKNNAIKIVSVLVLISLIAGFFAIPDTTDNNVNNKTLEDTNYDGIKQNSNTIQLNPDVIFDEHRRFLNKTDTYTINMTDGLTSSKIIVDGSKISVNKYSDTERDRQIFYDSNYTYKRIGNLSNTVNYRVSNESLSKSKYYPMDNLERLISSSKVDKYTKINNSLRIWMVSEDDEDISNIIENSGFTDYSLYINVSNKGLVNFMSVEYNNHKNTGTVRETQTYLVNSSTNIDVSSPHWKGKAVDTNPKYFQDNETEEDLPDGIKDQAN
jgi:hypothetical protein